MQRFWQRIKAMLKILMGAILLYFMSVVIVIPVMLLTGAGVVSIVIGGLIMALAIAIGAYLGGLWSRKNIIESNDAKSIAFWSASVFFTVNILSSAAGSILLSLTTEERTGFLMQAANIFIQSLVIYYFSQLAMRKDLLKK